MVRASDRDTYFQGYCGTTPEAERSRGVLDKALLRPGYDGLPLLSNGSHELKDSTERDEAAGAAARGGRFGIHHLSNAIDLYSRVFKLKLIYEAVLDGLPEWGCARSSL